MWNSENREVCPSLEELKGAGWVEQIQQLVRIKRSTLNVLREADSLFGLAPYQQGNYNALLQTIAELEFLLTSHGIELEAI